MIITKQHIAHQYTSGAITFARYEQLIAVLDKLGVGDENRT